MLPRRATSPGALFPKHPESYLLWEGLKWPTGGRLDLLSVSFPGQYATNCRLESAQMPRPLCAAPGQGARHCRCELSRHRGRLALPYSWPFVSAISGSNQDGSRTRRWVSRAMGASRSCTPPRAACGGRSSG